MAFEKKATDDIKKIFIMLEIIFNSNPISKSIAKKAIMKINKDININFKVFKK